MRYFNFTVGIVIVLSVLFIGACNERGHTMEKSVEKTKAELDAMRREREIRGEIQERPKINQGMTWGPVVTNTPICDK